MYIAPVDIHPNNNYLQKQKRRLWVRFSPVCVFYTMHYSAEAI